MASSSSLSLSSIIIIITCSTWWRSQTPSQSPWSGSTRVKSILINSYVWIIQYKSKSTKSFKEKLYNVSPLEAGSRRSETSCQSSRRRPRREWRRRRRDPGHRQSAACPAWRSRLSHTPDNDNNIWRLRSIKSSSRTFELRQMFSLLRIRKLRKASHCVQFSK